MTAETDRLYRQLDELKVKLDALAHENAELRVQRDVAEARAAALLPRATPEQEEEFRRQLAGPRNTSADVLALARQLGAD